MGCTSTKEKEVSSATTAVRSLEYQKGSQNAQVKLLQQPRDLVPENYRDGYVSASQFYNIFHGQSYGGAYIHNPLYLFLVDFRSSDEYAASYIVGARHHKAVDWTQSGLDKLKEYSVVVFYDHDGTAAANIQSNIYATIKTLLSWKIQVQCIVGGIGAVQRTFPHLITALSNQQLPSSNLAHVEENCAGEKSLSPGQSSPSEVVADQTTKPDDGRTLSPNLPDTPLDRRSIVLSLPLMPTLVYRDQVFLGAAEQAEDKRVIRHLGLTHIVSIGRRPDTTVEGVVYCGFDNEKKTSQTLRIASEVISAVFHQGGKVLVHGSSEGLNRSAAVVIAFLMLSECCTLDDSMFYLRVLRPHLNIDLEILEALLSWERKLFGCQLSDLTDL